MTTDEPPAAGLTELERRVLEACDRLQAAGVYPSQQELSVAMGRRHRSDFSKARDDLVRRGALVLTTRPYGTAAARLTRHRPRPKEPARAEAHQSTGKPFEAEAATIRRVMRWARRTAAKGGG